MAEEQAEVFDRETLLDLTVNVVPLVILLVFVAAFALFPLWGVDPLVTGLQFAIVGVSALLLVVLTYFAGKAVSTAENEMDSVAADPEAETAAETVAEAANESESETVAE